ncbi:serine hydrolase domain-containing protein [Salinicoccus hispanicus]|uniref:Serine hydrolase n=1 Tax=Salinicoccus hispanicus TaxID=157225 RepID=A0A6N8U1W9_9STAP|nr:serine hydrolase [Salinicoccus hispanicus]MXQ49679.1 serine hydrolase [Salinicoccus hispanicus]
MKKQVEAVQDKIDFSGAVLAKGENTEYRAAYGYADRENKISNNVETRFGIASGCKLFTAIAVSQLAEKGQLDLNGKLEIYLDFEFPHFDDSITIHHLLTHTSGVPDYFDEDEMDDFEALWDDTPMYSLRSLKDFIPLFDDRKMKFSPGDRFHYNNAGYILLGLVVESVSGMAFEDYVEKYVFSRAGMNSSGYFSFDQLPGNVATGYIELEDGSWKSNIYSLPVKGGADGGAFITVDDMDRLWEALMANMLLDQEYTALLLEPHAQEDDTSFYGYGVWIDKKAETIEKYHVMGYDPGVSFHSAYYPGSKTRLTVCANQSEGAYDIMETIEDVMDDNKI